LPLRPPPLILSASARGDGDLGAAVAELRRLLADGSDHIALGEQDLRPFDYRNVGGEDAFTTIAADMGRRDRLIFATPVYWYAMSGIMKTFFDRLADLLLDPAKRPLGRALAGRKMWVVATGNDPELPDGFEAPFRLSAEYLGMVWRGSCYLCCSGADQSFDALEAWAEEIAAA
jgi:putative NADPH-quinone reductase